MLHLRFGRLLVVGQVDDVTFLATCDCGNSIICLGRNLRSTSVSSCGCLRKEMLRLGPIAARKHGMHLSRTYCSWQHIKRRCNNRAAREYPHYGGRGIAVCSRWMNSFENFLEDMGEVPPDMSIDRINNDGNYEPSNCRWATPRQQALNKRSNCVLTFKGKTMTVTEWADKLGMIAHSLQNRIGRGWSTERALTTPVNQKKGTNS